MRKPGNRQTQASVNVPEIYEHGDKHIPKQSEFWSYNIYNYKRRRRPETLALTKENKNAYHVPGTSQTETDNCCTGVAVYHYVKPLPRFRIYIPSMFCDRFLVLLVPLGNEW